MRSCYGLKERKDPKNSLDTACRPFPAPRQEREREKNCGESTDMEMQIPLITNLSTNTCYQHISLTQEDVNNDQQWSPSPGAFHTLFL